MSNTNDRDLACRTAPRGPERALDFARRIPDQWFRAQALACVTRWAADDQVEQLARESYRTAQEAADPFRTVAVAAWPIRALIERRRFNAAKQMVAKVLELVPAVQPLSSRAESLMLLWQAVFPAAGLREAMLESVTRCCDPNGHWRAGRLYACVAWTLATESAANAEAFVAAMPEGKAKQKAAKLLRDGVAYPPRAFFVAAA